VRSPIRRRCSVAHSERDHCDPVLERADDVERVPEQLEPIRVAEIDSAEVELVGDSRGRVDPKSLPVVDCATSRTPCSATIPFRLMPGAVNQMELHPFFTQQALRDFHAANGIVTQAWSPLGAVNRYRPADANAVKLEHPTILGLAAKYEKTPAQVVLRWHIEHGVSAIPKSVKPHRIKENFDVFDFALAPEEVTAIDALDTGVRGGPDPELVDNQALPVQSQKLRPRGGRRFESVRGLYKTPQIERPARSHSYPRPGRPHQ
jgi:hypothetical protein